MVTLLWGAPTLPNIFCSLWNPLHGWADFEINASFPSKRGALPFPVSSATTNIAKLGHLCRFFFSNTNYPYCNQQFSLINAVCVSPDPARRCLHRLRSLQTVTWTIISSVLVHLVQEIWLLVLFLILSNRKSLNFIEDFFSLIKPIGILLHLTTMTS